KKHKGDVMQIDRGECRSLLSWLNSQENVIRYWIEEIMASPGANTALVDALERHQVWLSARISELAKDQAA
ncbi:MAG: hypothetical protein ACX939_06750, partial [Hyphococcus sp.]